MNISTNEIRKIFLKFFRQNNHHILPSSSLIPKNDSSILFTNSGMIQFKDFFLGIKKPPYSRIATSQRCLRVGGKHNDLDHIGYTTRHNTFFEMLGNFSFGSYFKEEAILLSWELLTSNSWFNLSKEKFLITVYHNDEETYNIWKNKINIPEYRIIKIGDNKGKIHYSDNFWQMSDIGPCGPSTEIFYNHKNNNCNLLNNNKKINSSYIEIWNLVFMQFNRNIDGSLIKLPQLSIDTGMGLERISSVLQNVNSNYEIDIFKEIILIISDILKINDTKNHSILIISDHIRSCLFLMNDGIIPSNEGRGYILRKIIRRAILHGRNIGIKDIFFYKLISPLIRLIDLPQTNVVNKKNSFEKILKSEEEQFFYILDRGLKLLNNNLTKIKHNTLDGKTAFILYDTYGFPFDLTLEVCRSKNINVDKNEFKFLMKKQQNSSKKFSIFSTMNKNFSQLNIKSKFVGYTESNIKSKILFILKNEKLVDRIYKNDEALIILKKTPFYGESGGQIGDQGIIKSKLGIFEVLDTQCKNNNIFHIGKMIDGKLHTESYVEALINYNKRLDISCNHTATHLLHSVLIKKLGKNIKQKGSLVRDNYLRFDFSYTIPISEQLIFDIESEVNEYIRNNILVEYKFLKLEDIDHNNVIANFNEKYTDVVRLLNIGDISSELCCGTHVNRTGEIGSFFIISESSISSGVRRIEGITGKHAIKWARNNYNLIKNIGAILKSDSKNILQKTELLNNKLNSLKKESLNIKNNIVNYEYSFLFKKIKKINDFNLLIHKIKNFDFYMLKILNEKLINKSIKSIIILFTIMNNTTFLMVGVNKDLINLITAKEIIIFIKENIKESNGGGNKYFAQLLFKKRISQSNITNLIEKFLYKNKIL